jgi:hypothetical protein
LSEAPDLFEAVLGWRCWIILGTELRSIAVGHSWKAEETAICKRPPSLYISADFANPPERHVPPADGCHCGLYAYHEPWMAERSRQSMEKQYGWQVVIGAVEMWGDVLVHGTGVRAEHARVLGLAVPPGSALRPWPASYRPGLLTGLTPVEAGPRPPDVQHYRVRHHDRYRQRPRGQAHLAGRRSLRRSCAR